MTSEDVAWTIVVVLVFALWFSLCHIEWQRWTLRLNKRRIAFLETQEASNHEWKMHVLDKMSRRIDAVARRRHDVLPPQPPDDPGAN